MLEQYYFAPLVIIVLTLYLTSWILAKTKKVKLINHRKLWNIILMISFFTSASLGMLLAFISDYALRIHLYRTIIWIHVEFGIILALTALFHFLWHIPYYLSIIRSKKTASQ